MDWSSMLGDGHQPYPHQVAAADAFLSGQSVVLRAPTGSGKTEAVVGPFLHALRNGHAPSDRLIYSLPMRVLATTLRDRAREWWLPNQVVCQHGDDAQAPLFHRNVVFATIDQSIESFITCPPTLPMKLGNIAAGAVASAVLAFDEVQLMDPRRALQAMSILLDYQRKLGLPFFIVTATLPDVLAEWLTEQLQCPAPIEVDEHRIPCRANRSISVDLLRDGGRLSLESVVEAAPGDRGNVAVICNTVHRAQEAYRQIKAHVGATCPDRPVVLLHSRFLPERRREIEAGLKALCGKEHGAYARTGCIVVSTQVIEAGIDICFDRMCTELAPVDSLIQRAGRVARGGGRGELTVYMPEGENTHLPYEQALVEATAAALGDVARLDWVMERRLVNEVIGPYLSQYLARDRKRVVELLMAEAGYERASRKAQSAVRQIDSCRLSIHSTTRLTPDDARCLEYISVPTNLVRGLAQAGRLSVPLRRVLTSWEDRDDRGKPTVSLELVTGPKDVCRDGHFICSPLDAVHDAERGLLLGERGSDMRVAPPVERPRLPDEKATETWQAHALMTAGVFDTHFVAPNQSLWQALAGWWGVEYRLLVGLMRTYAALHDLGKLNRSWQSAIKNDTVVPLAHSDTDARGLPAHATVSAKVLVAACGANEPPLNKALRLAVQHHHSVGAADVPRQGYCLIGAWQAAIAEVIDRLEVNALPQLTQVPPETKDPTACSPRMPDLRVPRQFLTYSLFSRALRLADWIATSGGDQYAPIHYENWFRNG